MTGQDFDETIRRLCPQPEIPAERVTRVIDSVLEHCDARRPAPARQGWQPGAWIAAFLPVVRFAIPMVAAAMLAFVAGNHLSTVEPSLQLSDMIVASSFIPAGY